MTTKIYASEEAKNSEKCCAYNFESLRIQLRILLSQTNLFGYAGRLRSNGGEFPHVKLSVAYPGGEVETPVEAKISRCFFFHCTTSPLKIFLLHLLGLICP